MAERKKNFYTLNENKRDTSVWKETADEWRVYRLETETCNSTLGDFLCLCLSPKVPLSNKATNEHFSFFSIDSHWNLVFVFFFFLCTGKGVAAGHVGFVYTAILDVSLGVAGVSFSVRVTHVCVRTIVRFHICNNQCAMETVTALVHCVWRRNKQKKGSAPVLSTCVWQRWTHNWVQLFIQGSAMNASDQETAFVTFVGLDWSKWKNFNYRQDWCSC